MGEKKALLDFREEQGETDEAVFVLTVKSNQLCKLCVELRREGTEDTGGEQATRAEERGEECLDILEIRVDSPTNPGLVCGCWAYSKAEKSSIACVAPVEYVYSGVE